VKPTCTPDGKWVIYTIRGSELWKVPVDQGSPVRIAEKATQGEVSPDGKWIGYISHDTAAPKLAIKSMIGDGNRQILDFNADAIVCHWNPDNISLTIARTENEVGNLWSLPVNGTAKQISHFTAERIFAFSRSRDGQLLIARGHQARDVVLIQRK